MVPILQLEGKWSLIRAGSIVMAVSDIALDYVNIHFLNGGMFGMGMSTSISYTLGFAVFLLYFGRKDRRFSLRFKDARGIHLPGFLSQGLPAGVRMVARMLSLVIINLLTINLAGATAMAAMAIQRNVSTVVLSAVVGLCGAVLTLTSISFGKNDTEGMEDALRLGYRHSFGIVSIFATVLFLISGPLVSLYIDTSDPVFPMAKEAVRWLAASMPLLAWNWSYGSFLHGIGQIRLSTSLFIFGELIVQSFTATVMGLIWAERGIFSSFVVSQAIILLLLILYRSKFFVPLSDKHPKE
jgi:Na+-driven multidrug efflux pump